MTVFTAILGLEICGLTGQEKQQGLKWNVKGFKRKSDSLLF